MIKNNNYTIYQVHYNTHTLEPSGTTEASSLALEKMAESMYFSGNTSAREGMGTLRVSGRWRMATDSAYMYITGFTRSRVYTDIDRKSSNDGWPGMFTQCRQYRITSCAGVANCQITDAVLHYFISTYFVDNHSKHLLTKLGGSFVVNLNEGVPHFSRWDDL